jgi:Toastrack DUF4097
MPQWTVDSPVNLGLDGVAALRVRLISGSVAVLSSDERPCVDVASITGQSLLVTHEAGILTITYPDLTWEGLRGWLRPEPHEAAVTVTVPSGCPTQIGVVNASAAVAGISGRTSVKSVSGNITLEGLNGQVEADTVSGDVAAQGLEGRVGFKSLSGDLTVAGGEFQRLDAKTVSGRITADLALNCDGRLRVATLSGAVTIRLPADADTRVDLRSTTGQVSSEFGGLGSAARAGASTLTGTLGAGSGRVSVTTMSGQVTLLERGHPSPSPGDGRDETEGDER